MAYIDCPELSQVFGCDVVVHATQVGKPLASLAPSRQFGGRLAPSSKGPRCESIGFLRVLCICSAG